LANPLKTVDLVRKIGPRGWEIVTVLGRRGFGDLIEVLPLPKKAVEKIVPPQELNLNVWQRLRMVLEDLGPTFVKFGQIMSTRPDVLPEALINEFKNLRSQVKPIAFEKIKPILCSELDCDDISEHFQIGRASCRERV